MAFLQFLGKNIWANVSVLKHALVICKTHRNWKLLPQILKFLEPRIFHKITIGNAFLFFSKQRRFPVTFLWRWDAQKYCWFFKFYTKYNRRNASFAPAKKRARKTFCEKIDATIRILALFLFHQETTERVCKFLRAISLGFNGKRFEWKHYSKITLWKLRKKNKFSYHRRELIVYATSFFVLWYQQSKT